MNDEDLKKIRGVVREEVQESIRGEVRKVVKEELEPIKRELGTINNELGVVKKRVDDMWEQTVKLSEDMEEIKESFGVQASATRNTNDNVNRLDKRLTQVEEQHGIIPPPELVLIR